MHVCFVCVLSFSAGLKKIELNNLNTIPVAVSVELWSIALIEVPFVESNWESFDGEQFGGTVICEASVSVSPLNLCSLTECISLEDPCDRVL